MVKKKLNKKKILIILTILLLILLILVICLKITTKEDEIAISKEKLAYINGENWNEEIYPKGMPAFVRSYSGKQTTHNLGKNIYYVVNELIPKYNNNLKDKDEKELEKYFEKNRELILLNFGIRTERDFLNLVDEILKVDSTNFKVQNFYIDESSIKKEKDCTKATLYIKYEGSKEISIDIKALNEIKNDETSVQYY